MTETLQNLKKDEEDGTASWTNELIKDARGWFLRKHDEVNYFFAQIVSDHGYFRAYREPSALR